MCIKRITALILIIVFCFSVLTACKPKDTLAELQITNVFKRIHLEKPEDYELLTR